MTSSPLATVSIFAARRTDSRIHLGCGSDFSDAQQAADLAAARLGTTLVLVTAANETNGQSSGDARFREVTRPGFVDSQSED